MTEEAPTLLWVCQDCYVTDANGTPSDDPDYTPDREPLSLIPEGVSVTSGMLFEHHAEDCPNRIEDEYVADCDCETISFSSRVCDGCGSTLAGSRYALTMWREE